MTPERLREIATALYRPARPSTYAWRDLMATDLGKSPETVKTWMRRPKETMAPGRRQTCRKMDEATVAALEMAFPLADQLRLWDRPEGLDYKLLFARMAELQG